MLQTFVKGFMLKEALKQRNGERMFKMGKNDLKYFIVFYKQC